MLPLRFLHALEIDLGYLEASAPPNGDGVTRKKFNCKKEFRLPKLTFHSDLRRRAAGVASRRALPHNFSF